MKFCYIYPLYDSGFSRETDLSMIQIQMYTHIYKHTHIYICVYIYDIYVYENYYKDLAHVFMDVGKFNLQSGWQETEQRQPMFQFQFEGWHARKFPLAKQNWPLPSWMRLTYIMDNLFLEKFTNLNVNLIQKHLPSKLAH